MLECEKDAAHFHVFKLELANYRSMIAKRRTERSQHVSVSIALRVRVITNSYVICHQPCMRHVLGNRGDFVVVRGQKSLRVTNENEYNYDWYSQISRKFPTTTAKTTTAITMTDKSRMLLFAFIALFCVGC